MTQLQKTRWLEPSVDNVRSLPPQARTPTSGRVNLYRIPWVRLLLENRWPQFIARTLTLLGFIFTIFTALTGTRVGSHNFAIIIVWIAWWTLLKLVFIPLGGRSWCSLCPLALPGDWLQQGGILSPGKRKYGLNLRWPKSLRGSWIQSSGFMLIGIFSAVTLTDPRVTGWILLGIFSLPVLMGMVFEKRAFCSFICPIGGFSGMYAKLAPVEVRVIDKEICTRHAHKTCYQACPWGIYPLALKNSSACGLCLECLRACPTDNIALSLRPYGADIDRHQNSSRLDEALLASTMLGSVLAFSALFLGPWGWLKSAAFEIGSQTWFLYAVSFIAINLVLLPGLFSISVWLWQKISRSGIPLGRMIANQAQGLLPLGLLAWIAFTISFALPKLNLILSVLNDPFGWGWNIFHETNHALAIDVSSFSHYLIAILLAIGVFWAGSVTRRLSKVEAAKKDLYNLPVYLFYLSFSIVLLWLLIG
jgi:NAD-dependent dihydropyrimidine dehydrogenase PreA subunit